MAICRLIPVRYREGGGGALLYTDASNCHCQLLFDRAYLTNSFCFHRMGPPLSPPQQPRALRIAQKFSIVNATDFCFLQRGEGTTTTTSVEMVFPRSTP